MVIGLLRKCADCSGRNLYMSLRRKRRVLWSLTTIQLAGAAAVLLTVLRWPVGTISFDRKQIITAYTTTQQADAAMPPLVEWMPLWTLDLRQPLYDPPPPPPPQIEKPKPPPITFKLGGIVEDNTGQQAMLILPDGDIAMLGSGQSIGNTKVVEIHDDYILVLHYGEQQTLKMESP